MINLIHHHYHTQCILLIENYSQGLGKVGQWQLIAIKESAVKRVFRLDKD